MGGISICGAERLNDYSYFCGLKKNKESDKCPLRFRIICQR